MKFPCNLCLLTTICKEKCDRLETYSTQIKNLFTGDHFLLQVKINICVQILMYLTAFFAFDLFYSLLLYASVQLIGVSLAVYKEFDRDDTLKEKIIYILISLALTPFLFLLLLNYLIFRIYVKRKVEKIRKVDNTFYLSDEISTLP